ncbi:serine/threonine-protein kinase [Nonomuraea soli]|uniref:Serine/threonine protein kinase n=1 Tax=Nonomuraea soli TaxID=1032476 RepID=A0A7W0CNZ2_9ACTN|nr:serine/threonine-protein kinase [Nonomuraea soli]MBA2894666.1 serine/threonine protein kinase [Nonomuraea soli]
MQALDPADPREIGAYHLTGVLGRGGQGSVYLARTPEGGQVAVKLLHARVGDGEAHRRYVREADAARRVAPFSTARVIDVGVAADRPYLVSEYIPGPSLEMLVRGEGPRAGSGLERLAVATLTALAAIHRAGIVHRDFKPSNVIMGPEGPVVIDFGIARALDHTTTHSIVGTPAFMAPEQFHDGRLTPAADLFSWASTMVYAATGQQAFRGQTLPSLMHAILTREPDLTAVPGGLRPILQECLAKEPEVRPAAEALLQRLLGEPLTLKAPTLPGPRRPADPRPAESRPAESRPAESRPADLRSADPRPAWSTAPPTRFVTSAPATPSPAPGALRLPSVPVAASALVLAIPAVLASLIMALLALRFAVDGETMPRFGWTRWETIRNVALLLAVPALAAALWRAAVGVAVAVVGLTATVALQLVWDFAFDGYEVMPQLMAGATAAILQGLLFLAAGLLSARVSVTACAAGALAGLTMLAGDLGWIAGVITEQSDTAYWRIVLAATCVSRGLAAVWLALITGVLLARAVRARGTRA